MVMALYFIGFISLWVIYCDCRYRRISNNVCVMILLPSIYLVIGLDDSRLYIFSFLMVFIATFCLFFLNVFGAGDSKLASAYSIALLPQQIVDAVILTLIVGGFLSVFYLIKDRFILKKTRAEERGLPYGLAITVGFYMTIINNFI